MDKNVVPSMIRLCNHFVLFHIHIDLLNLFKILILSALVLKEMIHK